MNLLEITTSHTRHTQDGHHKRHEHTRCGADGNREPSQIPRSRSEIAAGEKHPDEDRSRERHKRSNGTDTKQRPDRNRTSEDQKQKPASDGRVEPDRVDGGLGTRVDVFPVLGQGETVVTCIRESYAGGSDHAALAHCEARYDGQRQHGHDESLR